MSTPIQGKAISLFGKPLAPVPPNPANNDGIIFNFATLQWELGPVGGGGEANTSSNVGLGAGLALPKVGVDLPFKSLLGNPEVVLTPTPTTVDFAIGAIAQSKITGLVAALLTKLETSSNVGVGAGLALPKVGVDVPFKSLIATAPLVIVSNPTNITISTTQKNTFVMGFMTDSELVTNDLRFYGVFSNDDTGTESNSTGFLAFAFTLVRVTLRINTNSKSQATVFVNRDDGVDVPNTEFTIAGGVTGSFDSGAISETIAANSLINFEADVGAGGGTIADVSHLMECEK